MRTASCFNFCSCFPKAKMLAIDALLVLWHFFHYCLHYHLSANSHERRNCWHEIWMVFSVSFFFWTVCLTLCYISYMLLGVLCLRKELVLEFGYKSALRRALLRAWYAFIQVCKRSGCFPALEYYTFQGGNYLDVSVSCFRRESMSKYHFPIITRPPLLWECPPLQENCHCKEQSSSAI